MMIIGTTRTFAFGLLLAATGVVHAQADYPNHPIRWVVPFSAGSSPDTTARYLARKLGDKLKQPVIIDNRPGAGGLIGADVVAKAKPDGYTLAYLSTQHYAHRFLLKSLPYDVMKDFQPIQLVGSVPQVVVVATANPATSFVSFVAHAKAAPQAVTFGSGGMSSPAHLTGQALASAAGFRALHVPYKGSPESLSALIGGQVDYAVTTITTAVPQIKSGNLRALAVTSPQRAELLPDVPTLLESHVPDFAFESWGLLAAPVRTPRPIVDKLNTAIVAVLKEPDTVKYLATQGSRVNLIDPAGLPAFLQAEQTKVGAWIKEAGITLE